MYLKLMPKELNERYKSYLEKIGLIPNATVKGYFKINDDNTYALDRNGNVLTTFMDDNKIERSLKSGDFSRVEK